MNVVDVNRWVSQPCPIGSHRPRELLQHVDTVWMLKELVLHVPEIVPANLGPIVSTLQYTMVTVLSFLKQGQRYLRLCGSFLFYRGAKRSDACGSPG